MKVLIVSQPASDGVLRHVDLLCRFLIRQDVRLHLAYSDRGACDQLHDLVAHVAAQGGRTLNLRTGNAPQWADVSAMRRLQRMIHEVQPDVIHAHSSKGGGLVRGLGLVGLKTPIFYTPNAYYRMHDAGNWKARLFHRAERYLGKVGTSITMGKCEFEFARDVLQIPERQAIIIPNGIDTETFYPVTPEIKRRFRQEFDLPPDAPLLGSVGRFSLQKDPETLYAALAEVLPGAPDLFFAHLGRGELEPRIDAFLKDQPFTNRIRRIPYLADSARFYQLLDGFVLVSRYEGLSYAALEALACGLPMILTDAPGNSDLAEYGFSKVWRVKPGDVAGAASAMLDWYVDLRNDSVSNHRQIMLENFSEAVCNSRVLAAYERAVEAGEAASQPGLAVARP